MPNLSDPKTIRQIMKKHGLKFSKSLGQNFIIDSDICPKIVEQSGANENIGALEIGPGIGILTKELALRCKKVVAVEIDKNLPKVLDETLAGFDNVEIICADILKLDLHNLIDTHFAGMDVIVCANLPYYITSPVIMALLESKLCVKAITVMVQKEAAMRICAPIPSRDAGAVTITVRWFCDPRILFTVDAGSFMPPPDVTSAVIRLDVLENPPVAVKDEAAFKKVVKAAFSQRRKTMQNCLASGFSVEKTVAASWLDKAQIPRNYRAEQLAMEDFAKLADITALSLY